MSLFLIPSPIAEGNSVAPSVIEAIKPLRYFLAENIRTSRRFLSSLKIYSSMEALHFETLDKDTPEEALPLLMKPLLRGFDMGLLSEAGCPGIADPGAIAVAFAHRHAIKVAPLAGASSITLALMASGLNGQCFAFHGYLPVETAALAAQLKTLEKESAQKRQTQIFIETPYRTTSLLQHLLKILKPSTRLCVAGDLTGQEFIQTKKVKDWKMPDLGKTPAVFLFLADTRQAL